MAKREKFGKFVLLEDLEPSSLGAEYRAAKLGPAGLEKIVSILRLTPASRIQRGRGQEPDGPGEGRGAAPEPEHRPDLRHRQGRVRLLRLLRVRRREEPPRRLRALPPGHVSLLGGPRAPDRQQGLLGPRVLPRAEDRERHALLPRSPEPAATCWSPTRARCASGASVTGWPASRESGALRDEDLLYLAPEQAGGGPADPSSDIFAVGALLFEALTGRPLFEGGRGGDIPARLAAGSPPEPLRGRRRDPEADRRDPGPVPGAGALGALRRDPGAAEGHRHPPLLG